MIYENDDLSSIFLTAESRKANGSGVRVRIRKLLVFCISSKNEAIRGSRGNKISATLVISTQHRQTPHLLARCSLVKAQSVFGHLVWINAQKRELNNHGCRLEIILYIYPQKYVIFPCKCYL